MGGVAGGVTIAVGSVLRGAARGEFFAARRLRELPDVDALLAELFPADRGRRRVFWKSASRRWRAHVVIGPEGKPARLGRQIIKDIFAGCDGLALAFLYRNSRAIEATSEIPLAAASSMFFKSFSSLPRNSTTNPKPCLRRSSRLPDQELDFSPGGGPSQ